MFLLIYFEWSERVFQTLDDLINKVFWKCIVWVFDQRIKCIKRYHYCTIALLHYYTMHYALCVILLRWITDVNNCVTINRIRSMMIGENLASLKYFHIWSCLPVFTPKHFENLFQPVEIQPKWSDAKPGIHWHSMDFSSNFSLNIIL